MAKIFVSYSREDSDFVEQFIPLLQRAYPNEVYYDQNILGGAGWWDTILGEIRKCDVFIYLLSDDSIASAYCQNEFREALNLNKAFLPLIIKTRVDFSKSPTDIQTELNSKQWINISTLFTRDFATVQKLLFDAIDFWLKDAPSRRNSVTVSRLKNNTAKFVNDYWKVVLGGVFALLVAIIGALFQRSDVISFSTRTPTNIVTSTQIETATEEAVFAPTNTSIPIDIPPSNTPVPTVQELSATEIEASIQAEMRAIETQAKGTQSALETTVAEATRVSNFATANALTATASSWTDTPTPDVRATAEARSTHQLQTQIAAPQATESTILLAMTYCGGWQVILITCLATVAIFTLLIGSFAFVFNWLIKLDVPFIKYSLFIPFIIPFLILFKLRPITIIIANVIAGLIC